MIFSLLLSFCMGDKKKEEGKGCVFRLGATVRRGAASPLPKPRRMKFGIFVMVLWTQITGKLITVKILFTRFPLESSFGGAEVQVLSLMEGLLKRGHAVAFLGSCKVLLEECKKRNIPNACLDIGPPPVTKWNAISFFWRKKRMQDQLKTAISQFHDLDAVIMLSLSEKLLLTKIINEQSLITRRSSLVFWLEHDRIGKWLKKNPWLPKLLKLSNLATTIVVSKLSKKIYLELGWKPEMVKVIPNGIDPNRFNNSKIQNSKFKIQNFHIGCIARLTRDKGVDLLIEAVKNIPNVKLTIVGTGLEEKAIKRETRNKPSPSAAADGLRPAGEKRVTFLSHIKDLGSFYGSLDLLVLPSREHDPFGLVAAEAMMCGVPVIVTDACGIAGYLENEVDSMVIKAGSSNTINNAINTLITNEDLRLSIAKKGYETAMQKFSLDMMQKKYCNILTGN